jgi:hypothetical protein
MYLAKWENITTKEINSTDQWWEVTQFDRLELLILILITPN